MHPRRWLFLLLFPFALAALGPPLFAQQTSGSITSAQCVTIRVDSQSTVGIQVVGTWTGTLVPQISIQGQSPVTLQVTPSTSATAQSTITANGVFQAKVAGGTQFQVCGNTVASGTANVYLNASQGVAVIIPPAAAAGVTSFNSRTGAVVPVSGDYTVGQVTGAAPLASPTLTGVPAAPTAALNDNTTQLATDAFVLAQITASSPVTSVFTRVGAVTAQSGDYAWNQIGAGSNLNAQTMGTAGSMSPLNFGRNVSSGMSWLQYVTNAFPSAGITGLTLGTTGSLLHASLIKVQFTLVSSLGETVPNIEAGVICPGGPDNCSVIVPAQAVPLGYTGYTVYARNSTAAQSMQQIAGCVNIVAGCTITSIPSTSAPPTTNAMIPLPSLAKTSVCPGGVTPIEWIPDAAGNLNSNAFISEYFLAGSTGPQSAAGAGIKTVCRPEWHADSAADPPSFRNSFFLVNHISGNSGLNATSAQERAIGVVMATPAGDTTSHYSTVGVQVEVDLNGGAGFNPAGSNPDGEVAAYSGQISDLATANYTPAGYGVNVARFQYFKSGAGSSLSNYSVLNASFLHNNAGAYAAGTQVNILNIGCGNGIGGTVSNLACNGLKFIPMTTANRFLNGQVVIYVPSVALTPGSGDYLIRNDLHNFPSGLNAPVGLNEIHMTDNAALPINASVNVTGSITATQIASSWGSGYTGAYSGAAGASTYTYSFVAVDNNGGMAVSAGTANINNAQNPLDASDKITLSPGASVPYLTIFAQSKQIDVYRTSGPMATGKIGTLTCNNNMPILSCQNFVDTGLAATTALPTINSTGSVQGYAYLTTTNCAAVGTAASPSVASCVAASSGAFSCATNASAATCTINTTAVTANSEIFVEEVADEGTRLSVTCNTAPTVTPAILLATKTAGTGFTINMPTITVNPACFDYYIVN